MPSETRLDRAVKEAKRRGLGRANPAKALEAARKEYAELMAWARTIDGEGDGLKEQWAVMATQEDMPFFEQCLECQDRLRYGGQGNVLRAWAWHTFDHGHTTETPAPVASASVPPVVDASTDAQLTTRLREALTNREPSPEPDVSQVLLHAPEPSKPSYPILHRDCGIFGDCLELEDHVKIDVFVFDNGRVEGGETWPKNLFRRQNGGRLPWNE